MKFELILFYFFSFSLLLVFLAINQNIHSIYNGQITIGAMSKIQISSDKGYIRTKKVYVPERSFILAKQEIENILFKTPINFELNESALLVKSTLIKIVKILNRIKDDVALSILVHTDATGTIQHNLSLSQKRADRLKEYFIKQTNLTLVVAIGYGEVFLRKNKFIEFNLKRIK
jgi:outer membrane protein OmpA-like peptidoglycan-associated protein